MERLLGVDPQALRVDAQEIKKPVPYVISGDLETVMNQWAERTGFLLPPSDFFKELSSELTSFMGTIFPIVNFLSAESLTRGLQERVTSTGLPAISLDRVYYQGDVHLDVTRKKTDIPVFDRTGAKKTMLIGRRDAPPLPTQIRTIRASGLTQAALVDDVVFEGGVISKVMQFLERQGIDIPVVCAGVVVGEGEHVIEQAGKKLLAVKKFPEVIDEICERDFYAGVPYSGRSVQNGANVGVPYFLPFGRPNEWASIPTKDQVRFSRFCLTQSQKLYNAIEQASGRPVLCANLDRKIPNFPSNGLRASSALADVRKELSSIS